MKKIIGFIIGALMTLIGFMNIIIANIEMSTARGYTFRPPYTEYEAGVIITKYIGIGMLIIGIIILLLMIVSKIYYSKNVQDMSDVGNGRVNFISCPVCNCKTTRDSEYCPKCNHKLK